MGEGYLEGKDVLSSLLTRQERKTELTRKAGKGRLINRACKLNEDFAFLEKSRDTAPPHSGRLQLTVCVCLSVRL